MSATQGNARTSAPISTHPVFPAIVALWFAALLGLGCMIVPSALFERIVSATGIATIVPAAAPPLGLKAKMMIAGMAAILGAALGFWLGRKVANAQKPKKERRRAAKPPAVERRKAPILAHEELGPETFDAPLPAEQPKKRRGLAVTEETGPSEYLSQVPLPGEANPFVLFDEAPLPRGETSEQAEIDEEWAEARRQRERQEFQPVDANEIGSEDATQSEAETSEEIEPETKLEESDPAREEIALPERQVFEPLAEATPEPEAEAAEPEANIERQVFQPVTEQSEPEAAPEVAVEPDDEHGEPDAPLAFSPPSLARTPVEADAVEKPAVEPEPVAEFSAEQEPQATEAEPVPATGVDERAVKSLGTVELIERLAIAMRRREPPKAAPDFSEPAPTRQPSGEGEGDDGASIKAAFDRIIQENPQLAREDNEPRLQQVHVKRLPDALRPLDLHDEFDDDDEEDLGPLTLPLHGSSSEAAFPAKAPGFSMQFAADYQPKGTARGGLRAAPEFVRIDDDDAEAAVQQSVTFPGQGKQTKPLDGSIDGPEEAPGRRFDRPVAHGSRKQGEEGPFVPELNREDIPVRSRMDPAETERQLRSALATLQRISGAA